MRHRQHFRRLPLLLALGLAGCGGGTGSGSSNGDLISSFTSFVKDEIANTAATAAPATVNDRDFRFTDLENPDAFDDIL